MSRPNPNQRFLQRVVNYLYNDDNVYSCYPHQRINFDRATEVKDISGVEWSIVRDVMLAEIDRLRRLAESLPSAGTTNNRHSDPNAYYAETLDYMLELEDFIYLMEVDADVHYNIGRQDTAADPHTNEVILTP